KSHTVRNSRQDDHNAKIATIRSVTMAQYSKNAIQFITIVQCSKNAIRSVTIVQCSKNSCNTVRNDL
ncbi:hypothetical protein, partial [Paenibacillus odorifer]|uniref:hypothetical protein n=1 Tax=Paenibacillus odorifer TaxID=189426 RepID=UPI00289A0B57